MLGPQFAFQQHGQSGAWVSDRLPHFASVVDDVCFIKSMHTDQFNHGPAQLLVHTGTQNPGAPSIGAWATYGLGSENQNLPGFIVLTSGGKNPDAGKSVWGAGYLPSVYQGVQCRSAGRTGAVSRTTRRASRGRCAAARSTRSSGSTGGSPRRSAIRRPSRASRNTRWPSACSCMPTDAFDLKRRAGIRAQDVWHRAGQGIVRQQLPASPPAGRARRALHPAVPLGLGQPRGVSERGAQPGFQRPLPGSRPADGRPAASDLKQRGLLEDTLVVWGGEFGRTPMLENRGGKDNPFVGRDHNPGAFTIWLAGGGVKAGILLRRDRPDRLRGVSQPGVGARPARHHAAFDRLRPRAAELPDPRRQPTPVQRHQAGHQGDRGNLGLNPEHGRWVDASPGHRSGLIGWIAGCLLGFLLD